MTELTYEERMFFGPRLVRLRSGKFEDTASFHRAIAERFPYMTYARVRALEKSENPRVRRRELDAICITLGRSGDCVARALCHDPIADISSQLFDLTEQQRDIVDPTVNTLLEQVKKNT